jgi:DNA-binding MarR family transcriptional regulator
MEDSNNTERDRLLLGEIERDPDTTQATLAQKLGVAVGTVNWHVKRLISKGYVKVKRAERRKLKYIITPEGISLRARLTMAYVENSMRLYRESRRQAQAALRLAREKGLGTIAIDGDGDIADVVRLTCIEHGFEVSKETTGNRVGILEIHGEEIRLRIPEPVEAPAD